MAKLRTDEEDYTYISERVLTGSGFATSPELISGIIDLQRRAMDQSVDNAGIVAAADAAQTAANGAQTAADSAQSDATFALARANAAYDLAGTRVAKDMGPVFAAPQGALSRVALPDFTPGPASPTYSASEMQTVLDQVTALSTRLAAVITDLRANGALTG